MARSKRAGPAVKMEGAIIEIEYPTIKAEVDSDSKEPLTTLFQRLSLDNPRASKKSIRLIHLWNDYFQKGDLADFQRLCHDLGLDEEIPSKTQCRKALNKVNINITQFLGAQRKPDDVIFFDTNGALKKYTFSKKKVFPRAMIPAGSPLNELLKTFIGRKWL